MVLYGCSYIDVFDQGVWLQMNDIEDAELKELASSLPDVVLRGKAPSTAKKYSGAFARWKRWANSKPEVCAFPASPFQFSLYLNFLVKKASSPASVDQAVYALSWVHSLAVREDPTQHALVKQTLAGAKRILAKTTVKKEPITADILQLLVDRFGGEEASLSDIQTLAICLISFAGFFRFDEISNLRESDVIFFDDHLEIYIESSKTDQYRDGAWVVIART